MEIKELKIKYKGKLINAIIEVVDGVMVVSPKEEKVDVTKFKDGDIITCGWDDGSKSYNWTGILRGEIEYISDNMLIGDYCSLDCEGEFLDHNSNSDSATWVRYATEEEKKKLFDKLKEEGLEWNPDERKLVRKKWKPIEYEMFYCPILNTTTFGVYADGWNGYNSELELLNKGWAFRTKEECEQFCNKLNKAIEGVKP